MKILLLNQTFYPDSVATAQQLTDLATYLVQKGHDVSVIAGRRGYENKEAIFASRETFRGIKIYRLQTTGFGKQRFALRLFDALTFDLMLVLKLLFFPPQDIVVSFTSPPLIGFLGGCFCHLKGGRAVQWLMDINPAAAFAVGYLKRTSLVGRALNWAFKASLRSSSHIVVLDKWMKKVAVEYGGSQDKISVIHPWSLFEPSEGPVDPSESCFRKNNDLMNKTLIMYSGNHSVVHPLATLLQAAKQMRADSSIVFVFVGCGLRSLEFKAFKEKENLSNIVQLPLVPREQLTDSLTSVDAHIVVMGDAVNGLVHTSKVYGAIATGKPIIYIGPKKSHVMDLLINCKQTHHSEHGDVESVVDAISQIKVLSKETKERVATENKMFYRNQFSAEKCFAVFSEEVLRMPIERFELEPTILSDVPI